MVPTSTQPGAGARHDVGHAEGAADLDQLAARDDRLASLRERVEHEQHRGGIVVDDGRVLGAGQLAQQAAHVVVALAAAAAVEVEFERDRVAHRGDRGFDRRLRQKRATEIGVQHRAGEVEDRLEARRGIGLKARNRCGGCLLSPYRLDAVCPRRRQGIADICAMMAGTIRSTSKQQKKKKKVYILNDFSAPSSCHVLLIMTLSLIGVMNCFMSVFCSIILNIGF